MNYKILSIFSAYFLDLVLGDPQWQYHPIRLIGRLIGLLEKRLNTDNFNRRFSGVILVNLVIGITIFFIWGCLKLAEFIHPIFYYFTSVILIYFALSVKALDVEASKVKNAIMNENIPEARNKLSMLVGRDTNSLDRQEIIRASVETVAESITDGIVSPLCYVFLGGPILLWAYKAVNTLDSMVGYQSKRFIKFGWFSAKLDGLMNFIPARITLVLIAASSFCCAKDWFASLKWGSRYFFKGPKDNSLIPEAAMAGGLGIKLGGLNFYNGSPIFKPLVGDGSSPLDIEHIQQGINIAYICSLLAILSGIGLIWLLL